MNLYGDNALSIEQSVKLLPAEFAPIEIIDKKRQLATTSKGQIALRSSRDYFPASWWTSFKPELLEREVHFVVIALGFSGILIVPSHVVLDFGRKYAVSKLKNGRQNIRLKKVDSKIVMYEPGAPIVDLTSYFVPNNDWYNGVALPRRAIAVIRRALGLAPFGPVRANYP